MMHWLELKVPPPVVGLVIAIAMWAIARNTSPMPVDESMRWALAGALALAGAAFDVLGLLAFHRSRTTVNPLKPQSASSLVTSGIYRVTRNPMYVGMFLFLCAWAAWLGSWWALPGPLLLAAYLGRFQVAPEERILVSLFGDDYRAYQARVRRWI